MEVILLDIFKNGNLQNDFFRSWNHLNNEQQMLVATFISNVTAENLMCGRNKGQYYNKYNVFHYHIGYKEYNNFFTMNCKHDRCKNLVENTYGLTSEGVIYYIKHDSKIYILAFGNKHSPFPNNLIFLNILNSIKNL